MSDDVSDDDWFERAVSDVSDGADDAERDPEAVSADPETAGPNEGEDDPSRNDSPAGTNPDDAFATAMDDVDDAEANAAVEDEGAAAFGGGDDGSFDGQFGGDGSSGFGDGSPSGGHGEEGPSTGLDGGDSLFDDDFEAAFGAAGDTGEEAFDDESFESDISRIDLGIAGLDAMIQGGVPARHLIVAVGSAGTGKTTFGLQFLHHGLQNGENGVFITLEQSHDAILATADEWGWEFERYEEQDQLAIVDMDPVEMANSLDNIRGELPDLIEEFDADRLVLDSVSLLEMMYDDRARRRMEVFDFTRALKRAGVTTMLTSEANENNPYASRHGVIEYLTDAVFILQYVRSETQETRLAVEIQKIRNANHSRETKPYEITMDGISVYQQANIF